MAHGLLLPMGMTGHELLDLAGQGAMLAMIIRWLLQLDVGLVSTSCIGVASLSLQPWISANCGSLSTMSVFPNFLLSGAIAAALLGVAQVVRVN